ncbi:MauE/DoxX family redox-associated membrane protein [Algoriphagus boritolerans]|uniref:MauE/DoxX family redox-associated membrane protein n=1 Tax=Algoriphagus boritolerans TaxID=308111 RepID=UPI003A0FBB7E
MVSQHSNRSITIWLPVIEFVATITLLIPSFRRSGFILSIILMSAFTGYVAWVWLGFTERMPCTCGEIISSLTWGQHLILNLVFLGISVVGWRSWEIGR